MIGGRYGRGLSILLYAIGCAVSVSIYGQQAQSPRDRLQQYVTQLRVNPSDDALRTKIIQLALMLDPKPANPPDLPETIGEATYAFKNAQSNTDMQNAANLYAKAALEAPWRADLYFNEAMALEKAKRLDEAINAYRFYLLAAPSASDSDAVKEKIGALKYQIEQKQAADAASAQAEQQRQAAYALAEQQRQAERLLEGRYVYHEHRTGRNWWSDCDYIFDVTGGHVTQGTICNTSDGGSSPYQQHYTVPLNGRRFHYQGTQGDFTDGAISDDGRSMTVTTAPYAIYREAPTTRTYIRQ